MHECGAGCRGCRVIRRRFCLATTFPVSIDTRVISGFAILALIVAGQQAQLRPLSYVMPVIHIVLVKVKAAVLANGFDELKQKCHTLKDLPITQQKVKELSWGPPAYPGRNEGYNWGKFVMSLTIQVLLLISLATSMTQDCTQFLQAARITRHIVMMKNTKSTCVAGQDCLVEPNLID